MTPVFGKGLIAAVETGAATMLGYTAWYSAHNNYKVGAIQAAAGLVFACLAYRTFREITGNRTGDETEFSNGRHMRSREIFEQW